jgi:hypothetical protein
MNGNSFMDSHREVSVALESCDDDELTNIRETFNEQ